MAKLKYKVIDDEEGPDDGGRTQDLGDGHRIERRDPHGFWYFLEPGSKALMGAFTTAAEAQKALHRHEQAVAAAVQAEVEREAAAKAEAAFRATVAAKRAEKEKTV